MTWWKKALFEISFDNKNATHKKSMWSIQMFAVTVKFFRKSKMAAKLHDLHSA